MGQFSPPYPAPNPPDRIIDDLHELVTHVSRHSSSRADLARLTGLARSTVSQRVEMLISYGLLAEAGDGPSAGGRRPTLLALNPRAGVVLGAAIGASSYHAGVADLGGKPIASLRGTADITHGPDAVLGQVRGDFLELLAEAGRDPSEVAAIGIGLPGPVEFATGTVVRPPIMPGWDDAVVPDRFREQFAAPVVVDNDVNIMALGEHSQRNVRGETLLFVKVGTGIGCGILNDGVLHRGTDGAAGDIGHVRVTDRTDVTCACGNTGCLEAVASGGALVRQLRARGIECESARDVVRLAQAGEPGVLRCVREAGEYIGEVMASLVNFLNPNTIILGGTMAALGDDLLAVVRGVVYRRALPLATRNLALELSSLPEEAGLRGAIALALQAAISRDGLALLLKEAA